VEFRQMRREDMTRKKRIQACPYRSFGYERRACSAVRGLLDARKVRRGKLVESRAFCGQPKGPRGAVEQTHSQPLFEA
jgi:hypothetical protein